MEGMPTGGVSVSTARRTSDRARRQGPRRRRRLAARAAGAPDLDLDGGALLPGRDGRSRLVRAEGSRPTETEPRPAFDRLLAELRAAGDARMAQRQQRRAQPAVAKAQPPAATLEAMKAATLKAPPEAAEIPAGDSAGDRRAQRRAQHAEVMQQAMEACRAGRLGVLELAGLHP